MRPMIFLATLALLLAATPVTLGHGGWSHCGGTEIDLGVGWYLVFDNATLPGWMMLYMESNGIQYLQRGPGPYLNDACDEGVPSDTGFLVF